MFETLLLVTLLVLLPFAAMAGFFFWLCRRLERTDQRRDFDQAMERLRQKNREIGGRRPVYFESRFRNSR
jgi:hypothetical protein